MADQEALIQEALIQQATQWVIAQGDPYDRLLEERHEVAIDMLLRRLRDISTFTVLTTGMGDEGIYGLWTQGLPGRNSLHDHVMALIPDRYSSVRFVHFDPHFPQNFQEGAIAASEIPRATAEVVSRGITPDDLINREPDLVIDFAHYLKYNNLPGEGNIGINTMSRMEDGVPQTRSYYGDMDEAEVGRADQALQSHKIPALYMGYIPNTGPDHLFEELAYSPFFTVTEDGRVQTYIDLLIRSQAPFSEYNPADIFGDFLTPLMAANSPVDNFWKKLQEAGVENWTDKLIGWRNVARKSVFQEVVLPGLRRGENWTDIDRGAENWLLENAPRAVDAELSADHRFSFAVASLNNLKDVLNS